MGPRSRGSEDPAGRYGRSGLLTAFSERIPSGVVCWAATLKESARVPAAAAAKSCLRNAIETSTIELTIIPVSDAVMFDGILVEVQPKARTGRDQQFPVAERVEFLAVKDLRCGRPLLLRQQRRGGQREFLERRAPRGVRLDAAGQHQAVRPVSDTRLVKRLAHGGHFAHRQDA